MKKFFILTMLMSLLLSCQESKENAGQKLPKQYDRRVGEQIPLEVANRWANNFSTVTLAGRTNSTFSIPATLLSDVVGKPNLRLGVVLHHSLDNYNRYHLLICAMDNDGELFKNKTLDISDGEIVTKATAEDWASNYAGEHPTTPWYHFFGSDVFSEILSNNAFDHADITRGLNENNQEQILLFVYNTKEMLGGRSEGAQVVVYDATEPCPPCSLN